jgi:predicted peroxiredoxin
MPKASMDRSLGTFAENMKSLIIALLAIATAAQAADKPLKMFTIVPGADIVLKDDCGLLLVNDGDEKNPIPRYILAVKQSGTVVDTKNSKDFMKALQAIPKGTKVFAYSSCTVPRSYGLTDKQIEEYYLMIKKAGLQIQDDPRITCYCDAISK